MKTNTVQRNSNAAQDRFSGFPGERAPNGSRDPLTLEVHWDWRNPFNVLPIGALVLAVAGLVLLLLK